MLEGNVCDSALSGTCLTDTFLNASRTTMLLCESNRTVQQNKTLMINSGNFWEWQPCVYNLCVYCYTGLGRICLTMTSKAIFCYCTVVNKKCGWQQVKTFSKNQKMKTSEKLMRKIINYLSSLCVALIKTSLLLLYFGLQLNKVYL